MAGAMRVLYACMVLGFTAASAWSVRLACADHWFRQQTIRETEMAIALTPGQADYYLRLGLLESELNSPKAIWALQRAVALNPSDARSWIELGLRYERRHRRGARFSRGIGRRRRLVRRMDPAIRRRLG